MTSFTAYAVGAFFLTATFIINRIILQIIRIRRIPPTFPWIGPQTNTLSAKLRSCFSEPLVGRARIQEGYDKYSKTGLPFVLPGIHWPGIVLPSADVTWVASQPEHVLSHTRPFNDMVSFDCLSHGPSTESVHDFAVIRKDLNRQMRTLIGSMTDELIQSIDCEFSMVYEEWKELKVSEAVDRVIFRMANRIFVGKSVCRDEGYRAAIKMWSTSLGISSMFIRYLVPFPVRSWIGPIVAAPSKFLQRRALAYLLPMIRQRLKEFHASHESDGSSEENMRANDMLQWIIENNARKADPSELNPSNIGGKLILFNLFAVNTTSIMTTTVILDILSYHSAEELVSELRAEAGNSAAMGSNDSKLLDNLPKIDSVIRESLRYNPFLAQGILREVMQPEGILTPSGVHVPQGCHVHSVVSCMQRDDSIVENSGEYDPLRSYRMGLKNGKQSGAVQLDGTFLTFGLGRYACPGRYFAVHSMKLVLRYILLNYDFLVVPHQKNEYLEVGDGRVPSPERIINVRRRRGIDHTG